MKKCILTLAITGILGSAVLNAEAIEKKENSFTFENAKPVKKHKKKYSNRLVKKSKRSGFKF